MNRRNRFGRPNRANSDRQSSQATENAREVNSQERQPSPNFITLPLRGHNPFKHHNAYLIPGAKHILVDPGPPGSAGELLEQLSRNRVPLSEIGLIVITHGHPDHFGTAAQFKEWTHAPLAVHELDAEYVSFGTVPTIKPITRLGTIFKSMLSVKATAVEPDIVLQDGDRLGRYAGKGVVIHTPGHTAGSISILLPGGVCIVGDLVMRGIRARTPSTPWFAESLADARDNLQKVVSTGAVTLLAAHGGPFKVEDLARRFKWLHVPERQSFPNEQERVEPEAHKAEGGKAEGEKAEEPGSSGRSRRRRPRRRRPRGQEGSSGRSNSESTGT